MTSFSNIAKASLPKQEKQEQSKDYQHLPLRKPSKISMLISKSLSTHHLQNTILDDEKNSFESTMPFSCNEFDLPSSLTLNKIITVTINYSLANWKEAQDPKYVSLQIQDSYTISSLISYALKTINDDLELINSDTKISNKGDHYQLLISKKNKTPNFDYPHYEEALKISDIQDWHKGWSLVWVGDERHFLIINSLNNINYIYSNGDAIEEPSISSEKKKQEKSRCVIY